VILEGRLKVTVLYLDASGKCVRICSLFLRQIDMQKTWATLSKQGPLLLGVVSSLISLLKKVISRKKD